MAIHPECNLAALVCPVDPFPWPSQHGYHTPKPCCPYWHPCSCLHVSYPRFVSYGPYAMALLTTPGLLFSLHICVPSPPAAVSAPLPPLPPQACMLAVGSGSPHRHCAPSPLLHRNPHSLYMLTHLTVLTFVPPVPPLAPYCTPAGCFLLAHQLQTSFGLGKSPNCLVIQ